MSVHQRVAGVFAAAVLLVAASADVPPPKLPDPVLTPGVADPAVTQANIDTTICVHGYTAKVRNVPDSEKRAVFAEYHIDPKSDRFEVDHLISLELGGSNDIKNLGTRT